jgi:adenylate kinase
LTRLLIVGPPGAGKGTQSALLTERFSIPDISTGNIFRANIKNGTPLGKQVVEFIDAGDYVPDSVTNALITHRLEEPDALDGFLLDGYPRTLDQIAFLDELLATRGQELDAVIQLVADQEEVVSRLRRRAIEQGRTDDTEEAIRHRQEVYARETAPLFPVFRDRGILIEVDGLGEVEEVSARITEALAQRGIGERSDTAAS